MFVMTRASIVVIFHFSGVEYWQYLSGIEENYEEVIVVGQAPELLT